MGLDPKKKVASAIKKGSNLIPTAKSVFAAGAPFPLSSGGLGTLAKKTALSKVQSKLPLSSPFGTPATVFIEGIPVPKIPSIGLSSLLPKIDK